jgi:hypothetical protein
MAKRKLTMNKRPERSKNSDDSSWLIKDLYDSFREGLSSDTPEENAGCGCIITLLIIGLVFCFFIAYNRYQKIDDKYNKDKINIEQLDKYIKKAQ